MKIVKKKLKANIFPKIKKNPIKNVSSFIRHLLIISSADEKIEACELEVIYLFAKKYNYSKSDIVQQIINLE